MKKYFLILHFLVCVQVLAQNNADTGIQWTEGLSWDDVKARAKKENKFIFVDAYATWCAPCKVMDSKVYPDKTVGDQVNTRFISVKVQMDETDKDNEKVKAWHPVAKALKTQYEIAGYPSFLFFSPDGEFAYKDIGMKSTDQFIALVKEALTDPEARYKINVQKFKNGQLAYSVMPDMAREAAKKKDPKLYWEVAKMYKNSYLDKLKDDEVFTFEHLNFISMFRYYLVKSGDRYFNLFRFRSSYADSLLKKKESRQIITDIIRKEEVFHKIYKDDSLSLRPILHMDHNWEKIRRSISKKYPEVDAHRMIIHAQINFYREAKNWPMHFEHLVKSVEKYGVTKTFVWGSNEIVSSFIHCQDSLMLSKAISWTEPYILQRFISQGWEKMVKNGQDSMAISSNNDFSNYACLLYKAGRRQEAINWVEWHIKLFEADLKRKQQIFSDLYSYKKIIIERMRNGEPIDGTWKAVWFH